MNKDKAKEWGNTEAINDPLTELLRSGAKALIQQAVEAELQAFLGDYTQVTDLQGRLTVVRNGYLPERAIVTGVGNVTVKIPKVRDRSGGGVKFNSTLV
ncbi:MAG: transposase, partial [Methylicorpusculum sp.]|uniref:transposase n=1 Tax=Methylicorpusculum sp. TaxID=2713644 RepID=UPI00271CA97E